jgi:hypothetical protein
MSRGEEQKGRRRGGEKKEKRNKGARERGRIE